MPRCAPVSVATASLLSVVLTGCMVASNRPAIIGVAGDSSDVSATTRRIEMIGSFSIPIESELYTRATGHLLGDGLNCDVVMVSETALRIFLGKHAKYGAGWWRGPIGEKPRHMRALKWLTDWMEEEGLSATVGRHVPLTNLPMDKSIFYRIELRENDSHDLFMVRLWVIYPSERIVLHLNGKM